MKEQYISTAQAAKILGISRVAVFKKIKTGQIRAIKIGRNFAIDKNTLVAAGVVTPQLKKTIAAAVKKTVQEYGQTLNLLSQE